MGIARGGERIRYEPTVMRPAEVEFRRRYPQFDPDGALEELRRSECAAWTEGAIFPRDRGRALARSRSAPPRTPRTGSGESALELAGIADRDCTGGAHPPGR